MIVQIYSLTTATDVCTLVDSGINHLGFVVNEKGLPAEISVSAGQQLFELVPDSHNAVSLTVKTDPEAIVAKAEVLPPDILHICSDTYAVSVTEQRQIVETLPDSIALMKAISVDSADAVEAAKAYEPVSDYLLLDTVTADVPGVGASGETHDWTISREIVETVSVPVVLAGGLGPENVREAVETVRPAGVDSYTKTSANERRKDLEKVNAFAERARSAAAALEQ